MNLSDITAHWVALYEALGLGAPVREDAHYEQLLELAESLMENSASLDASPLAGLAELLGARIREYEDARPPMINLVAPEQNPDANRIVEVLSPYSRS